MEPTTAIALGSAVLGGAASFFGQKSANDTNVKLAQQTSIFNAKEAAKNREFQERMSSTAKRREMQDLKLAGLNPLLAGTGGASTPSGSAATGAQATVNNAFDKITDSVTSSALESSKLKMAKEMQAAQLVNMVEQNKLLKDQQLKTQMETKVMSKGVPEADIKNRIYKRIEPVLQKLEQAEQNSAAIKKEYSKSKARQEYETEYMKKFTNDIKMRKP